MSAWDGEDRFSLLLLEDGEYYFRDFNCHFWEQSENRVAGQLKVCSASLFFVPRDVHKPIFRIAYRFTSVIERAGENSQAAGEDTLRVASSERMEMKRMNRDEPYKRCRGSCEYLFSLVYTSLGEVLPKISELWRIARKEDTKEDRLEAKQILSKIIKEHEANERFNPGWLEDENERVLLELVGNCITPLCSQPGRVVITFSSIYFQPFNVVSNNPIQSYPMDKIVTVMKRTFQLRPIGLEIFFSSRTSLYLTFRTSAERERADRTLREQPGVQLQSQHSSRRWMRDWVHGKVSNFEYLMFLNRQAGRSFMDLTQYPVFPWTVQDYTSPRLDLSNPATFRDLSKPIGALNAARLAEFRARFAELRRMRQASGAKAESLPPPLEFPPFLYGCHYSAPGYVVYYLMRSDPQLMLRLQNGRFDAPDRLFWSILDTWKSVTSLPTDVKELIPEFYSADPAFLLNLENVDFGTRTNGDKVGDLELPPWATDAQDFVHKLSAALESPFVSARLHRWIDLIFGYRSRGPKAEAADNIFHYLTYDDVALQMLAQEDDPVMQDALRVQMMEFGRTPQQLFTKRHPKRRMAPAGDCAGIFCFSTTQPKRSAKRPTATLLRPTFQNKKHVSPTVKAVARLTSSKLVIRQATLAWLEQAGMRREPEYLTLSSHTELSDIVKSLRECRETQQDNGEEDIEGDDVAETLVRGLRVLAIAPLNRSYMLEAGALEPLTELFCTPTLSVEPALYAISLLSREEDARLNSFPAAALERLLALLADWDATPEMRATAAQTLAQLSRSLPNRTLIIHFQGLELYLGIIGSWVTVSTTQSVRREVQRVVREVATGLLALLEDDRTKLQAAQMGCLEKLVAVCSLHGPDNDVRALAVQCLAVLSTHFDLRPQIMAAGSLQVLGRLAKLQEVMLQIPTAAALANLFSDSTRPPRAGDAVECFAALNSLALSSNRDVQRHVARALWHLVTCEESRQLLVEHKGVATLLRLAQSAEASQSQTLAQQALKRLAEDPEVQRSLPVDVQACLRSLKLEGTPSVTGLVLSPGKPPAEDTGDTRSSRSPRFLQRASPRILRKQHKQQAAAEDKGQPAAGQADDSWDGVRNEEPIEAKATLLNRLGLKRASRSSTVVDGVRDLDSASGPSFVGSDVEELRVVSVLPSMDSLVAASQGSATTDPGAPRAAASDASRGEAAPGGPLQTPAADQVVADEEATSPPPPVTVGSSQRSSAKTGVDHAQGTRKWMYRKPRQRD